MTLLFFSFQGLHAAVPARTGGPRGQVEAAADGKGEVRQRKLRELAAGGDPAIPLAIFDVRPEYLKAALDKITIKLPQGRNHREKPAVRLAAFRPDLGGHSPSISSFYFLRFVV